MRGAVRSGTFRDRVDGQTGAAADSVLRACSSAHAIGSHFDVLQDILQPGVNLSLWQRPAQETIARELASLRASDLPDVRCVTSPGSFDEDVVALLKRQDLDPADFGIWRKDLRQVAKVFFRVYRNQETTMRLATTDVDGCCRFHVDHTQLRLLCTYRGPGTEWLPDGQVDRSAQRAGAPNEDIIRFGEPSQFSPFWVGILKGSAYPGNECHGLVHRSPPTAGSGQIRVLFCLDC